MMFTMKPLMIKRLRYTDKIFLLIKSFVLALMTFACTNLYAQEDQGFVVDEIISKVDNYIVLKSELDRAYLDYLSNGNSPSPQMRCQFLAMLIRNKLMMAKAEIDSVVVPDAEVDQNTKRRMDAIMAQAGNSPEDLEAKFGKTLDQVQVELRDQIREQMIVGKMQEKITQDIPITPSEVRRFFGKLDSIPYFSASVEVGEIVRVAKVSNAQKEETKRKLIDIRNRILSGEDFTKLAKEYSEDPSVAMNNGDMGFVGRGQMVPEFEAASFKMKPGEISMPVETQYGFHIIQLLERRGNEYHSRHILVSPIPSAHDLENASHYLDSIRTLILADSMTFQKAAKEYSDDAQTKATGGFLTDPDGGSQISIDEIDPVIYFKIDSMKIGDISKPIVYRTDQGKDAVRILYFKSRISPHRASLKDDWHRIQTAALSEKKNRILEKWFNKARHDVFISIDPEYDYCGILKE
jgi:peptidyl-prolyl cis-trans isomerase SurA